MRIGLKLEVGNYHHIHNRGIGGGAPASEGIFKVSDYNPHLTYLFNS